MQLLLISLAVLFISGCDAHGRLSKPTTRDSVVGLPDYQSNTNVPEPLDSNFVCRNLPASSSASATVAAGGFLVVRWDFTALHEGDCFFYLSYDPSTTSPVDMQWFKIAQIADCKRFAGSDMNVLFPTWVPAGRAVLRFEWYALQQYPNIEFYCQCSDILVTRSSGSDSGTLGTPLVKIPGHLPANSNNGQYRNPFDSSIPFFFTGPAVAVDPRVSTPSTPAPTPSTPAPTTRAPTAPAPTTRSPTAPAPTTRAPTAPAPTTRSPTAPAPTTRAPTAPAPTTRAPTTAPPSSSSTCENVWGQCGGMYYSGSGCCASGSSCIYSNAWYSQCLPNGKAEQVHAQPSSSKMATFLNDSMIAVGSGLVTGLVIGALAVWGFVKLSHHSKSNKVATASS
eukprot:TRINITY_DN1822_c0_g1_i6.p1 TRINITY_DN1822_c0_g1~~TRINITY_DN1822_c0_g1_i6.p1  ORF type:complete len:394 (+),score=85.12 TRINITY_DN1822_c0_g1_i6:45-1226(+)